MAQLYMRVGSRGWFLEGVFFYFSPFYLAPMLEDSFPSALEWSLLVIFYLYTASAGLWDPHFVTKVSHYTTRLVKALRLVSPVDLDNWRSRSADLVNVFRVKDVYLVLLNFMRSHFHFVFGLSMTYFLAYS